MPLLVDRIVDSVSRHPARPAFIAAGGIVTYRQLLALLSNTARFLHERGVRPGDVVGLWMGQSPLHLIAFLALARLGAVTLPLYPNVRPTDRVATLRRFGARAVVTDAEGVQVQDIPVIALKQMSARGDESDLGFTPYVPAPDAPMRIALTSGSAGAQKAVLHAHEQFLVRLERRPYGDVACPRVLPPVLHITSALQLALHALLRGGAVVFPKADDAASLLQALHAHAVTHLMSPPADLRVLLSLLPEDQPAFPSLAFLNVAGDTASPELAELARRKMTPNVVGNYSTTEVGVISFATPEMLAAMPRTSGRLVPGAHLEVLDAEGRHAAAGESGEIRVATEAMPQGYHGPHEGPSGFRDGWFYTGDRGRMSPEGFLFLEGRRDGVLNIGGHKATAEHLESILCDHPNVWEVAVFAYEEDMAGMRIAAAVVARGGLDWNRLRDYARTALGPLAPVRYFSVERLPRNSAGKTARAELAAWVAAHGQPIEP